MKILYFIMILLIVSCSQKNVDQSIPNNAIDQNMSYIQAADLLVTGDFDFGTVSQNVSSSKIITIKNTGLTAGRVKIDLTTIFQTNGIFTINYGTSDCFVSNSYKVLQPQYSCQIEMLLNSGTASGSIFAAIPLYDELAANALIKNLQASVVISATGSIPPVGKSCITAYHKDPITSKCVSDYKDCTPTINNAVVAKKHWNSTTLSFDACLVSSCVPSYSPANNGSSCALSQEIITINKIIDQGITNVYDSTTNALIGSCPSNNSSCQISIPALSNIKIESIGSCGYDFSSYADSNCLSSNFSCLKNSITSNLSINPIFTAQNSLTGYHLEGQSCVINSKTVSCPTLSVQNASYNPNMDTYTSIWNGSSYSSFTSTFTTNLATSCGYQCNSGFSSTDGGLTCVAVFSPTQACTDSAKSEVITPNGNYSFSYGNNWTLTNNYITYQGWIQMNIRDAQSGLVFDNGKMTVPYGIQNIMVSPDGKNIYFDTIFPSIPGPVLNGTQAFPTGTSGKIWAYTINALGKLDLVGSYDAGSQPRGISISPDGKSVYVSSMTSSIITMFIRSTTNGSLSYNKEQTIAGNAASCLPISPDGSILYLDGSIPYNRHTGTGLLSLASSQETCIAMPCGYQCGSNFYRTTVPGQTCTETYTPELALNYSKTPIVVTSDGLYAYQTNQTYTSTATTTTYKGWIQSYVRDTSGKIFKAGTTTTTYGFGGIALAPDNKTIYITNYFPSDPGTIAFGTQAFPTGTNGIITPLYVDSATGSLTKGSSLPTQSQPRVPAVSQDSLFVYVPNNYNQSISKFAMPTPASFQTTTPVVSTSVSPTGAAAVSPDNKTLYIEGASSTTDFSRNLTTGNLTTPRFTCAALPTNAAYNPGLDTYARVWNGTSYNVTNPTFTTSAVDCSYQCAIGYNSTDGGLTCTSLYNPIPQLALTTSPYMVTPNGKYAYSFSSSVVTDASGLRTFSAKIQKYDRDATTGILYPASTISTIYGPNTMAISPDGKNLSITSQFPATPSPAQTGVTVFTAGTAGVVSNFSINATTGDLSFVNTVTVGSLPQGLAFSPDGTSLYVANAYSGTKYISILSRNKTSGAISSSSTLAVSSIVSGSALTVSPDSTKVYLSISGSYLEFVRLTSNGLLSLNKTFTTWP